MKKRTRLFWLVTAATVGWLLLMRPFTPPNIIEFEFARTAANASTIMTAWGVEGVDNAKVSLLLDFVFLILYSWAISLGCTVAAGFAGRDKIARVGMRLSQLTWFAGGCDAVENISLLMVLHHRPGFFPELAFWTAAIKFTLVLLALLFIVAATAMGLVRKSVSSAQR